ncbi:NAD-dependent epimerase/dehydratase family protein [Paenibacillus senegalimassiliensis]|uniref:NAD-dependent epimerase/dehydratase family protein n=1 Tax=Paenibacillus senegalimassiliensis TaxID=1737426 RepID=UPI00073E7F57|nr:NAD-dependent epimerase/dehydratase family protein [Paenibacillus senegalimassiliensis]
MANKEELHVVIGTGPLGRAVMDELLARGKQVRMVNRSGAAKVPAGVQVVKGDAVDRESILAACQGATVIYHCAKAPYTRWPELFPPITEGILGAAEATGAKLVYGDNLYMYGPTDQPLKENLPERTTDGKGIVRAAMAKTLLDAHRSGKARVAIGRAPDFYGPGVLESALGARVFRAVLAGKAAGVLGNVDAPHTYIYIRDYARGLVTLGEQEAALGQVWHIPSAETLTTRQIVELVFTHLGQKPKISALPKPLLQMLALFGGEMREVKGTIYMFDKPFVVDHGKYAAAFGTDTTPHSEAIRETLEWYKQQV